MDNGLISKEQPISKEKKNISETRDKHSLRNERKIYRKIYKCLPLDRSQTFGQHLGLDVDLLQQLERECSSDRERENLVFRVIEKWKTIIQPPEDEIVSSLVRALVEAECHDAADTIQKAEPRLFDAKPQHVRKLWQKILKIIRTTGSIRKLETKTFEEEQKPDPCPLPQKEPETIDRAEAFKEYQKEIFNEISSKLYANQWRPFGLLHLGLDENQVSELESQSLSHGTKIIVYRLLTAWKDAVNPKEDKFAPLLVKALQDIGRKDIADSIKEKFGIGTHLSLTDLLQEMQEIQRKEFRDLSLPTFWWLKERCLPLEELFVELNMKKKNKWGKEENEKLSKEKIFEEIEKGSLHRILIEGHPGYGKTTLLAKFLSDWSRGEAYISDRFDLVFIISLRNFEGDLTKELLKQFKRIKRMDEEKLKAIENIGERVLLLLDGLDEISSEIEERLIPLIKGEEYREMVIVFTCRTGFVKLKDNSCNDSEFQKIQGLEKHSIWDKRVEIKGISPEKREEFLQNYLNADDGRMKMQVFQANLELGDLYECPLFLLLMAVLIQEKDVRAISTKTKLYKTIFNFVITRALEKAKRSIKEFDVFDLESEPDEYGCRILLINFGRLCLDKIKNHSLIFKESELLTCFGRKGDVEFILKFGILSKQISFSNRVEKEHYEPIHKSFIEFLAAFFLSSLNETDLKREVRELLLKYNIGPKEDQFIYPFLGGFLQSNAFQLFNILSPYRSLISIFNYYDPTHLYYLENVLLEIPQTEQILKSLENLSIGNWERVKYKNTLRFWFVGLLNNVNKRSEDISLSIPENMDIINEIGDIDDDDDDHVRINTVRVDDDTHDKFKLRRKIQCRNLIVELDCQNFQTFLLVLKELRVKVKAQKIWLKVKFCPNVSDEFKEFFKSLIRKNFYNFKFNYLSLENIPPACFSAISHFLKDRIEERRIENGVRIKFSNEKISNPFLKKLNTLFEKIVPNSDLKSFSVDSYSLRHPLQIPLSFFNNEKPMEFVGFRGSFGEIKVDDVNSFSVKHFHCVQSRLEDKNCLPKLLLRTKDIKRLSCNGDLISDLGVCDSIRDWKGFETVERLDLDVEQVNDKESFVTNISLFKNLREICFCGLKDSDVLIQIMSRVSLKKISYSSFDNFLIKLLESLSEKKLSFDELEVKLVTVNSSFFSSQEFIDCLEKCFASNIFRKFSILRAYHFDSEALLKRFISSEKFHVSSQWREEPCCDAMPEVIYNGLSLDESPELICRLNFSLIPNRQTRHPPLTIFQQLTQRISNAFCCPFSTPILSYPT